MKKFLWFLPCFFMFPFLWAQDWETDNFTPDPQEEFTSEIPPAQKKEKFRMKNRAFELSVANFSIGFSNDFISAADILKNPFYMFKNMSDIVKDPAFIYQDPVDIWMDDLWDGFNFNFGAAIKPLSFNINWKDKWGFGLDIAHIEAVGNMSLAGNMMALKESDQVKSGASAAVFVDMAIPIFFHIRDLKIKVRPAVYVPLLYFEPSITYSGHGGTRFAVNYSMLIYSPFNMEGMQDGDMDAMTHDLQYNYWNILKNNLGYDFALGVEYPLNRRLDIGVDIVNIPFATARLNNYLQLKGKATLDTSKIDIDKIIENEGDLPENFWDEAINYTNNGPVTGYNADGKKIFRPFKMLFYANYRPFGSQAVSLIPSMGFSINRLYVRPGAVEGGLSARFDWANIIITTLGINYNDRKWKNSIDFVLNLRAIEFDLGLAFQSQNFRKSWQGAGLGVNAGIKLGW